MSFALCPVAAVTTGRALGFDPTNSGADTLFVVRRGERLSVYLDRCPHQGVALEYRKNAFLSGDGEHIMCYAHGARFEIESGRCIHGPCLGQSLRKLGHRVADGWIWLDAAELEPCWSVADERGRTMSLESETEIAHVDE